MDPAEVKSLKEIIKEFTKKVEESTTTLGSEEEKKLKSLVSLYRNDEILRLYISICMINYARGVLTEKLSIYIEGMRKLEKIVFGNEEEGESHDHK